MRFLNPKTDFAFKRIFGSEASREVLVSFLNAVLALEGAEQIVEVTILDPYQMPRIKGWKDTYVDVRARDRHGRSFIVEMQVLPAPGLEKRVLYNACKAYVGQIQQAEDYRKLVEVIAITITDFFMFRELREIVSTFRLSAAENPGFTNRDLALVFVELPKFTKTEAEVSSPLDRWLYFLKEAGVLDAVPASLAVDPAIEQAFEIANRAGLSDDELRDQERREQWIGMLKSLDPDEARREGEVEGRRQVLLELLCERFGDLPVPIIERVRSAKPDLLARWTHRLLKASSIDEVFG